MKEDFFILNSFSKFLEISGEDKAEFLQGLISNDIYKCKSDTPIYSCMLSPQGKFIADFFIIQEFDKYLIEIHEKYLESFIAKIQIYKLRSKVEILNLSNEFVIAAFSHEKFLTFEPISLITPAPSPPNLDGSSNGYKPER